MFQLSEKKRSGRRCHRIAVRLVITTIVFIFAGGKTFADDFNLDSLLLKSVGGEEAREAVANFHSMYMAGDFEFNGQTGRFELQFVWPDTLRMDLDFGAYRFSQFLLDQHAYQLDHNGRLSELHGFEKRELIKQGYMASMSYLKPGGLPGRKEYLGPKKTIEGKFHEVAFYPSEMDTVIGLFDMSDGRLKIQLSRQDNLQTVTRVDDYQTVDHLLFPFLSRTEASNAPLAMSITTDTVEVNPPFDRELFVAKSSVGTGQSFPPDRDSVIIPIRYRLGHIHLKGKVNGRPYWFILDSGASANMFDRQAMMPLGLEVIGQLPSVGVSGFEKTDLAQIDSIEIGGLKLGRQVAGLMDLEHLASGTIYDRPFGGILGYDFLSSFPMEIDYRSRRIIVYNPERFELPEDSNRIEFSFTLNVPTVTASLCGQNGEFVIDLGNALGLIVHPGFFASHDFTDCVSRLDTLSSSFTGIGGLVGGQTAVASRFDLGHYELDNQDIILPESTKGLTGSQELAGNIGNPLLSRYRLLLDYRSRTLILHPY